MTFIAGNSYNIFHMKSEKGSNIGVECKACLLPNLKSN